MNSLFWFGKILVWVIPFDRSLPTSFGTANSRRLALLWFIKKIKSQCRHLISTNDKWAGKHHHILQNKDSVLVSLRYEVFQAFCFVNTCNKLSSLVNLKVHDMLFDQNCVTAVYASIIDSTQSWETETRHKLFADQSCQTHRVFICHVICRVWFTANPLWV